MSKGKRRVVPEGGAPVDAPILAERTPTPAPAPIPPPAIERTPAPVDDGSDGLPRTDVDLEADLEALRDWVKTHPHLINHCLWLDLDEFEARVEQIITLLPKEIRRARRIVREEQRIIQDSKDEARRILEEARAEGEQIVSSSREEAIKLVDSSAIRQRAVEQAELTIVKAEETAREVRMQSYNYAGQVMNNVEVSLKRLMQSVEQDHTQLQQLRPDGDKSTD